MRKNGPLHFAFLEDRSQSRRGKVLAQGKPKSSIMENIIVILDGTNFLITSPTPQYQKPSSKEYNMKAYEIVWTINGQSCYAL